MENLLLIPLALDIVKYDNDLIFLWSDPDMFSIFDRDPASPSFLLDRCFLISPPQQIKPFNQLIYSYFAGDQKYSRMHTRTHPTTQKQLFLEPENPFSNHVILPLECFISVEESCFRALWVKNFFS